MHSENKIFHCSNGGVINLLESTVAGVFNAFFMLRPNRCYVSAYTSALAQNL